MSQTHVSEIEAPGSDVQIVSVTPFTETFAEATISVKFHLVKTSYSLSFPGTSSTHR